MNRLWFRSFAATALVVVATLLAFGVFSQRQIGMFFARDAQRGQAGLRTAAAQLAAAPPAAGTILRKYARLTGEEYLFVRGGRVAASAPVSFDGSAVRFDGSGLRIADRANPGRELRLLSPPSVRVAGGVLLSGPALPERGLRHGIERTLMYGLAISALVVLLVSFVLTRSVLAPIARLTAAAQRISAGDYSQRVAPRGASELAHVARAFNGMAGELERDRRLRETLVRDLAHEIRTPLTNLACQLEAMQDGIAPIDRAGVDAMRADLATLERLVDGVQELALVRVSAPALRRQTVQPGDIVEPVVRAMQSQAAAKGVELRLAQTGALPPVHADVDRVRQVIANLIGNALRHTPAGGTIRVAAGADGTNVALAVSDTGEGIAAADLPRIFERAFTRSGSGLGLAIAREIVEAHGGTIVASSAPGNGTTVRFTLPAASLTSS